MNTVERVKMICKERKIPISRLERDCGFANGYISQLKKGSIPDDRLQKIADYFGMTVNELLGVQKDAQEEEYYLNIETKRIAQEAFEDPMTRALLDARRGAKPEDVQMAINLLIRLKETNPDG